MITKLLYFFSENFKLTQKTGSIGLIETICDLLQYYYFLKFL